MAPHWLQLKSFLVTKLDILKVFLDIKYIYWTFGVNILYWSWPCVELRGCKGCFDEKETKVNEEMASTHLEIAALGKPWKWIWKKSQNRLVQARVDFMLEANAKELSLLFILFVNFTWKALYEVITIFKDLLLTAQNPLESMTMLQLQTSSDMR